MSSQLDYTCLGNYLVCLIMWIFQSPIYVETLRFYTMMQAKLCARQKDLSTASYLAMRMDRYWSNHQAMIAEWHLDIGGRCSLYLCSVVTWRMRVCNNSLFPHAYSAVRVERYSMYPTCHTPFWLSAFWTVVSPSFLNLQCLSSGCVYLFPGSGQAFFFLLLAGQ